MRRLTVYSTNSAAAPIKGFAQDASANPRLSVAGRNGDIGSIKPETTYEDEQPSLNVCRSVPSRQHATLDGT
jgi:hypothetical protein